MTDKTTIQGDARGQYARSEADRNNAGLASATPRAVTGKEDATMANASKKPSPKPGFDIRNKSEK